MINPSTIAHSQYPAGAKYIPDTIPGPAQIDPRPLETLTEAVNPGYDEHGEPLASPFPPHRPHLTQLDRHEYEACALAGTKIMMPHANNKGPRHMTTEFISNIANCSHDDARNLLDCFIVLETTEQMVKTYSFMARERGAEAVVDYLWRYVMGAVEAEAPSEEIEPWMLEPVEAGPIYGGIFGRAGLCEDVELEAVEIQRHTYSEPDEDGEMEVIASDPYEWDPTENLDWTPEEVESNSAPNTIAYHVMEDVGRRNCLLEDLKKRLDYDEYSALYNAPIDEIERIHFMHCGWMARQPKEYLKTIKHIRREEDLGKLLMFGQAQHKEKGLTRNQQAVLWTEYHQRRKALERSVPQNITTIAIMKRIEAGVDLGNLGRLIYKAQKGQMRVHAMPSNQEFRLIWKAWKHKRLPQLLRPIKAQLAGVKQELLKLAA